MNLRQKRNILFFVARPLCFALFVALGFVHWIFIVVAFVSFVIFGTIVSNMKCPNCGTKLGMRKHKYKGGEFYMESSFMNEYCEYCGHKF